MPESFSAPNSVTKTNKPSKSNRRVEKLSENQLDSIDMTGTLRSEWKIVQESDNRVSLAVKSSPLWEFEGVRSVLYRLM